MSEDSEVRFVLDGQTVEAMPGETVLSVAKRHGIEIPALCNHEAVSPYGACRLCVVEAFWGKRSKLVTACIYMPWADERIETNSDRVRRARKMILELLLARCPEVELIRSLAREYGVEESRFRPQEGASREERCILCGLCVRVCAEGVRQNAIGYAGRGIERMVATPFIKNAEECIGCGACVFICPTDALHYEDKDGCRILKELNTSVPMVACRVCGEYFTTVRQLAEVRRKLDLPDELAETCPRCRGSECRVTLETNIFSKTSSSEGSAGRELVARTTSEDKE